MGEHKRKILVAGNGDEGPKLSTHIIEVLDVIVPCPVLNDLIEAAYLNLAERAKSEDSFILNVVQAWSTYQTLNAEKNLIDVHMLLTITAQRISRAELEQQQMRQRMGIK